MLKLVSTSDIAARIGKTERTVRHWATKSPEKLPTPIGRYNQYYVYELGDVIAWEAKRKQQQK